MSKQPIKRWLAFGFAFAMCVTLVFVAGATGQKLIILLALVLVPAWGWFCKQRGWL